MRLAFHANALTLRGTEVAMFDYANYFEELLQQQSVIVVPRVSNHHPEAVKRFQKRFQVLHYQSPQELEQVLAATKCDALYCIKYGTLDGVISQRIPTFVHAVFDMSAPHGNVYAAVSDFLSQRYGGRYPVVPHMVDLPDTQISLRKQLNIPETAIVFGRHGGEETFDLQFAQQVVDKVAAEHPERYFVFLYTKPFCNRPNVLFLAPISDPLQKAMFIESCDAMLHARQEGETFGLACGEFSIKNRPVITYAASEYTSHLDILGEAAIRYSTPEELYRILKEFRPRPELNWDRYSSRFNPVRIMERFREVFLPNLQLNAPTLVSVNHRNGRFNLLSNDNLCRNLIDGKDWEPHLTATLQAVLRPGDLFIDIGAAFGYHSVSASRFVGPLGRVYAFEPQSLFFELLRRNILDNSLANIRPFHRAVANRPGEVTLNQIEPFSSGINLGDRHISSDGPGERVKCISLDSLQLSRRVRLIKIDVQGAELPVLQGADYLLQLHRPYLIVEFEDHCLQRYRYTSKELFQFLRNKGYEIFYIEYEYPSDHLCVPAEEAEMFRRQFRNFIQPHTVNNQLNNNLLHGVTEKLSFPLAR